MNVLASVSNDSVMVNLEGIERAIDEIPKDILDVGIELLRLTQLEVPHDKGTLQNSGVVEVVGQNVVLGYHTPYAARLHEHPEYHFQRGRKGKYIEDPIRRNEETLGLRLVKNTQDNFRGHIS